jgi:choline dehydrogenase-like flavoprotein
MNGTARQTVSAKKEVILAAGSLHSPQLLQVSGIGDPILHAKIGVATIVDLPSVGQNLQDHVLLTMVNTSTSASVISKPDRRESSLTPTSQRSLHFKPTYQQRDIRR